MNEAEDKVRQLALQVFEFKFDEYDQNNITT